MIELVQLQKTVDQHLAVDITELRVEQGTIAAVVGAVGSGKEVIFDLLLGRTRPTVGQVRLAGFDPAADHSAFSRQVGVLFAEDGLYQNLSARANLRFHCQLHGLPKLRADEVLAEVGLADHARVRAAKLPSGLKRRLAFGRALLSDPLILLLANPLERCDAASIQLLAGVIRQRVDAGTCALVLADDVANLGGFCDVVYTLDQGRIVDSYCPDEETRTVLPFKVPVKMEDKVVLINPGDILYALAQDGRAILRTHAVSLPTQFTLTELEERLARSGFFRAHRGYLVNLQHVREVIPYTRNSFTLILDDPDDTEIPLSKSAAGELRELLDY